MKKAFKIIDITIICVLFACLVASVVAYFVVPTETKEFFNCVIDFINKPLPIAGVSIAFIGYFLLKLFANTSLGKKQINKLWDLNQELKDNMDVQKVVLEKQIELLTIELEKTKEQAVQTKEYIDKVATTIPNKKVNELVAHYGKEEERQ